jgi:hypothetical protein
MYRRIWAYTLEAREVTSGMLTLKQRLRLLCWLCCWWHCSGGSLQKWHTGSCLWSAWVIMQVKSEIQLLRCLNKVILFLPVPVAVRSKAWVFGRSLPKIPGSNPDRGHECLSLVSVVFCRVEVSVMGRSLVQRSSTKCGVSECDLETTTRRRSRPTRAVDP